MKTGMGLALIALGAIFAFAVTTNTSVFNLHTAGYILIVVGIAGLAIPRRGYGWVGRRLFVRRYEQTRGAMEDVTYPSYVNRNPGNTRVPAGLPAGNGAMSGNTISGQTLPTETVSGNPTPENVPGETKVVEDVYEE
jgi:hypothetical protein